MVLHGILCGRVGRCQEFFSKGPEFSLWAFFFRLLAEFLDAGHSTALSPALASGHVSTTSESVVSARSPVAGVGVTPAVR